ncbi:MAG: AEC family transporter [bacterium]
MFFKVILTIFALILLGYLLAKIKRFDLERVVGPATDILTYVIIPCFVFAAMLEKKFAFAEFWRIALSAVFVITVMGLVLRYFCRRRGIEFREVCLPVMFMNSGYLGLPVVFVLLPAGLYAALIYNITMTMLIFTLGILLVSGGGNFSSAMKEPVSYVTVLGIVFNLADVNFPPLFLKVLKNVGTVGMPIMLLIIGYQLHFVKAATIKSGLVASCVRIGGGFVLGVLAVKIFGLTGVAANIVVMISAMPAAVLGYVFAKKYDAAPEFAASVVLISTAMSIVSIPLVLKFLNI